MDTMESVGELSVGKLRQAIWAYNDHIPVTVRLINGNHITHGMVAFDEKERQIVISANHDPDDKICPFCNTPIELHLPPLRDTLGIRCPTRQQTLARIRAKGHKLYWSNKENGWVIDASKATLFASKNDPSVPDLAISNGEWEKVSLKWLCEVEVTQYGEE